MKKMNSLTLLLVRLVFRRYKQGKFLQLFLQLLKYVLITYVVRCLSWFQEFYIATFSFFTCNFSYNFYQVICKV